MAANAASGFRSAARIGLAAVGGLAVLAVRPVLALGDIAMMGGGYGGVGGVAGFGGFLWPLLVIGGVVALLFWGGTGGGNAGQEIDRSDSAVATLRERYARGELTEAEFEERRRRLER